MHLVDPGAMLGDLATQQPGSLDIAISAAVTTFSSRIGGALIGNILAGTAIKVASDYIRSKVAEKKQRKEETDKIPMQHSIPAEAWAKLLACIALDLVGDSSFALPGIGELEDVVWAPVSSFSLKLLFGSNAIAGLDFFKEILPGTDFLPVGTLAWVLFYLAPSSPISKLVGLPDLIKLPEKRK